MSSKRRDRMHTWIDSLDVNALVEDVESDDARDEVRDRFDVYVQECFVGLDVIDRALDARPHRILEVGSGAGLLVRFLRAEGFDVRGLEPSINAGFSFMNALDRAVAAQTHDDEAVLPIGIESLDPDLHGRFDLIYSVNVLEHVANLDRAFEHMAASLTTEGRMVHSCPNYRIPYEPHFALPLVPGRPQLTRPLLAKHIDGRDALWRSLNFVTAGRVQTLARRHGLHVEFRPGTMAASFQRLRLDPSFRARHRGLLAILAGLPVVGASLEDVLRRVPGSWQSPMTFDVSSGGHS